jgi:hypothetical protein
VFGISDAISSSWEATGAFLLFPPVGIDGRLYLIRAQSFRMVEIEGCTPEKMRMNSHPDWLRGLDAY